MCKTVFQNKRRPQRENKSLYNKYLFKSQTLKDLSDITKLSKRTIQKKLDKVIPKKIIETPQKVVLTMDVTFFERKYGVLVFRSQSQKKNIYWTQVDTETVEAYVKGRHVIEAKGYEIEAIVIDGKKGVKEAFKDIPVQLCQFHQMKAVTKYLTRKPKLEAGQKLREIMLKLAKSTEINFTRELNDWYREWGDYINQQTRDEETKKWFYTHGRIRSAYLSMRNNIGYLFTFERYPNLKIPNTTNSLDGTFSHLKRRINIHRGLRQDRRYKMIEAYLSGESSV